MAEFFNSLLTSMEEMDFHYLSDEKCCEVLALVFQFGSESMVTDPMFNRIILHAQKRLNLFGGVIVNTELLPLLQRKIKELEDSLKLEKKPAEYSGEEYQKAKLERLPEWATELASKHGITLAL